MLSPLTPSQTDTYSMLILQSVCEGEDFLRGGLAPSFIYSPLQPMIFVVFHQCVRPERGQG